MYRPTRSAGNSKRAKKASKKTDKTVDQTKTREFDRWWRGMEVSSKALRACHSVIHVGDCETDSYELMSHLLKLDQRFVFRVRISDRRSRPADNENAPWIKVKEVAQSCEGVLERDVPLTRRKKNKLTNQNKAHPPRKARLARLSFSATRVVIARPQRVIQIIS
jgi:hypothetical protein